ncbi:MAG TPA: HAD family hydrolase, partial [Rubricoccaceae bacterium]
MSAAGPGAPPAFVFFDLDDTLLDHKRAERAALADLHVTFGEHVGHHALAHLHAAYHAHNAPLWADFGAGRITSAELKRLRSERFLAAVGATGLDPAAFSDAYLDRYAHHWSWAEGAR